MNNLVIVQKPWGREEIWAQTPAYVGKLLYISAGKRLSRQYHKLKDETIMILEGQLILELGRGEPQRVILNRGTNYHIPPNTVHRFCAPNSCDVTLVEVGTPQHDDIVRLEDDFARI